MGHVAVDEDDSYNERFWEQVDWYILMARREAVLRQREKALQKRERGLDQKREEAEREMARREAVLQQREMALQKRELQCSQEERGLDQKREEAARELTCQREEVEYEMARREKEVQQRERQCSQKERTLDQKCEESEREAARRREEVEREMRALDQKREETEREMAQRGALLEQREKDVRERERRRRVLDTCAAQTLGGDILEVPHTDSDGKEDDHLAGTLPPPLEEGEVPPSPLEEGEVPPTPRHREEELGPERGKKHRKRAHPPRDEQVTQGFTQDAAPHAKTLGDFAKMKAKLEGVGCWKGSGWASIECALAKGEIDDDQYHRYRNVNWARIPKRTLYCAFRVSGGLAQWLRITAQDAKV